MANLPQSGVQLIAQDAAAFFSAMRQADRAVATFGETGAAAGGRFSSGFGQVVTGALREVGAIATRAMAEAGRAVAGFVVDGIKSAGDFQQGLNVLQAVTNATDQQMQAIRKTAIDLGNDMTLPATSAADAADAMTELAKAGLSVDDSLAAARGTLQLATAAETDAGNAAQIVAGALNAFHLEGADAVRIADLLAGAANASSASMTDLAQGLQQGGFMFNATGQQVDDLVASLAILTNVGLTGSDAGTALKNAMVRLTNPTKKAAGLMQELGINVYDAQGKMLPFRDIIGVLNQRMAGMTDQQRNAALGTIFLSDGMKAMIPLMDAGVAGFDAMKAKVSESGSASALAGAQMKGFNGALAGMKNALETAQLVIGEAFLPALTTLLNDYITPAIGKIGAFAGTFLKLAPAIFSSAAPLGTFFNILRIAAPDMLGFINQLESIVNGLIGFIVPIYNIISTLPALIAAVQTSGEGIWSTVQSIFGQVAPYIEAAMTAALNAVSAVLAQISAFWSAHGAEIMAFVQAVWPVVVDIITKALQLYYAIATGVLQTIADVVNTHGSEIQNFLTNAWRIISGVIQAALALIQGILTAALDIMQGDWEGAWTAIQRMSATFVQSIWSVIQGFLSIFDSEWEAKVSSFTDTWQYNWDTMVAIIEKIPERVVSVGAAIVNVIKDGFSRAWESFVAAAKAKLAEFRAMLPFSEPKDTSSPLYGLSKSGAAIVTQLATGVTDNAVELIRAAQALGEQMITQFKDTGERAARALNDSIRDALDFRASIPRTLDQMDQFLADFRAHVGENLGQFGQLQAAGLANMIEGQVQAALRVANQLAQVDPEAANRFFRLRTDQIREMAELQEQLLTATDPAERTAIQQRIARIQQAQQLEFQSFLASLPANLTSLLSGLITPAASPSQAFTPAPSGTISNVVNYSPTYNQPPGSPAYDLAILGAFGV